MGIPIQAQSGNLPDRWILGRLRDVNLKRNDRIEAVTEWDEPLAEHSSLRVDRIDATIKATVSLLRLHERQS
jgi:hypothetical protein